MSNATEKAQLYMIKGVIADMKDEDQVKIKEYIEQFTAVLKKDPENACIAFGYIGLDLQVNPASYGL